ncbi:hypothetical protein AAG570_001672 [Ranatra chinensis]|uniref:Uncharacterized protein n=1 Tax=Ranatra chinensis TaxID=642074 RepID=A0ABD0Y9G8_9HEMI
MAFKRRNISYEDKKQETTEILDLSSRIRPAPHHSNTAQPPHGDMPPRVTAPILIALCSAALLHTGEHPQRQNGKKLARESGPRKHALGGGFLHLPSPTHPPSQSTASTQNRMKFGLPPLPSMTPKTTTHWSGRGGGEGRRLRNTVSVVDFTINL